MDRDAKADLKVTGSNPLMGVKNSSMQSNLHREIWSRPEPGYYLDGSDDWLSITEAHAYSRCASYRRSLEGLNKLEDVSKLTTLIVSSDSGRTLVYQ